MKNAAKFLALGLSVCMLMGSVPAVVCAEDLSVPAVEMGKEDAEIRGSEVDVDAVTGDDDGESGSGSGGYSGLIDQGTVYDGTMNYDPGITYHVSGARELRTMEISGNGEWRGTGLLFSPDPAIMQYANVRNIVVNEGITNLPDCAFKLLEGIHHFTLPDGLLVIGSRAFQNSTRITELQIPDSVTTIGSHAFASTFKLQKLNLPKNLESVGDYAFYFTTALEEAEIPSTKVKLGKHLFQYSGIKKLTLPGVMEDCPDDFFSYLEEVENLYFKGTKEEFYSWTADYDVKLAENCVLHFGENGEQSEPYDAENYRTIGMEKTTEGSEEDGTAVTTYRQKLGCNREITWELTGTGDDLTLTFTGSGALGTKASDFEGKFAPYYLGEAKKIKKVVIGDGITAIGPNALKGFENLEEAELADSVKEIGDGAFSGCGKLQLVFPKELETIGAEAFANAGLQGEIALPKTLKKVGQRAFASAGVQKISFASEDVRFGKETFADCPSLSEIILPENLTAIPEGMFSDCKNLATCSIPDSVEEIGDGVIAGCESLTEFRVPSSLKGVLTERVFGGDDWEQKITKYYLPVDLKVDNSFIRASLLGVQSENYPASHPLSDKREIYYSGSKEDFYHAVQENEIFSINKLTWLYFNDDTSEMMDTGKERIDKSGAVNDCVNWNLRGTDDSMMLHITGTGSSAFDRENLKEFKKYAGGNVALMIFDEGITDLKANAALKNLLSESDLVNNYHVGIFEIPSTVKAIESPDEFWNVYRKGKETSISYHGTPEQWDKLALNSVDVMRQATEENPYVIYCSVEEGSMTTYRFSAEGCKVKESGTCGNGVNWYLDGNLRELALVVSGSGCMDDYQAKTADGVSVYTPQRPWEKYASCITLVEVSGVTSVGANAFRNLPGLETVNLQGGVGRIGAYAFADNKGLSEITIPSGVGEIGTGAFENAENLSNVTFSAGKLRSIGKNAFAGTNLAEVRIPSSVASIGSEAFLVESLKSVVLPKGIPYLASDAFGAEVEIVPGEEYCERGVEEKETGFGVCGNNAEWRSSRELVEADGDDAGAEEQQGEPKDYSYLQISGTDDLWKYQPTYTEKGKNSYAKSKNVRENGTIYSVQVADGRPWATNINKICIGEGITGLSEYVFAGMTALDEVKLPESLTRIDKGAFINCKSLAKIEIGKNVKSIGKYAFYNCANLTDIYYEGGETEWNRIVDQETEDGLYTYDASKVTVHFNSGSEISEEKADEKMNTHVVGANLTLRDSIDVHVYLTLSEELFKDEEAYATATLEGGETRRFALADLERVSLGKDDAADLIFSVNAKELHDKCAIRVFDGNGKIVSVFDMSGKECGKDIYEITGADCCESALAIKSLGKEQKDLLKSVLNYGTKVQKLLGYKTENLKNVKGMPSVDGKELQSFEKQITGKLPQGITYCGMNIEMKSKNEEIFYFKAGEGMEDKVSFTIDRGIAVPERNGEYLIVRIRDIRAADLGIDHVIGVREKASQGDGESGATWRINANAFSYVYEVQTNRNASKELKDAAKALYIYGTTAERVLRKA
uniref:leucine-rich repeat domain-containing protein n=1 Tax=Eubacterium cellulosolvens TaxID=29322 RepID=UPI000488C1FC|nr:leucine-rich repeat domain-containing protein [[Eubacterium] cellulosolvens]